MRITCWRRLYSNVLAANYTRGGLQRVAILGNSFDSYMQVCANVALNVQHLARAVAHAYTLLVAQALSTQRREAEASWSHMARMAPYVHEDSCDQTVGAGDYGNAFNNMSLHTFGHELPAAEAEFWSSEFSIPPDDDEVIGRLIDVPQRS